MKAMEKTGVLFVCLGNICRSPIAEGIFRKLVKERGLEDRFEVDSAATGPWHVGEGMDPRAAEVLKKHGAYFEHTARQVTPEDFERFDLILAADREVERDLLRLAGPHRGKVRLITEPWGGGEISDPWQGDLWACEETYTELADLVERWLSRLHEPQGDPGPGRA